jgi:hypothetical protein
MNNLFPYLLEINIGLVIMFTGYKLFFEKDRNFLVRRIYLLATILLPVLLVLLPDSARSMTGRIVPVTFHLEQITVFGYEGGEATGTAPSPRSLAAILYLSVASLGMIRFLIHLAGIMLAVKRSERLEVGGITLYANPDLHASSFFGYIFVDPDRIGDQSFEHIVEHERVHRREYHSVDRVLAEFSVLINWFNPVAWMLKRSVVENLEYLTDLKVVAQGTDSHHYQLSILNQYIGSASITNQFSSQIKNRINMLNKNYKVGSTWKIAMIFPMVFLTLFIFSCADKDGPVPGVDESQAESALSSEPQEESALSSEVFYIVEEMPLFQGEKARDSFRKYIAQNLHYPPEASANHVTGRVYITFVVTSEGKVVIPEKEYLANITGKELDEVVVVGYKTLAEGDPQPAEKDIDLLKEEVIRVVRSSPDWTPGRQHGKAVNVIYTFPVNFVLQ